MLSPSAARARPLDGRTQARAEERSAAKDAIERAVAAARRYADARNEEDATGSSGGGGGGSAGGVGAGGASLGLLLSAGDQ